MNRIITILVTIFILLLLYIWISHVWGSDNPRRPREIVDATGSETLGADDSSPSMDTSYLLTDEEPVTTEETQEDYSTDYTATEDQEEVVEDEPEPVKEEPKKPEPKKPEVKKEEPKAKTVTPATPPATKTAQPISKPAATISPNEGKHLVIVGNFLQRVNADQRLQELKKAGFDDVEVVNFDLSEYHTVCAGRFEDVNDARRLVKKLKDYHKIDAYVRIGS